MKFQYHPLQIIPAQGWKAVAVNLESGEIMIEPLVGFALVEDRSQSPEKDVDENHIYPRGYEGLVTTPEGIIGVVGDQEGFIGYLDPENLLKDFLMEKAESIKKQK